MLLKFFYRLLVIFLFFIVIFFAISNPDDVILGIWPIEDKTKPLPLYFVILVSLTIGIFIGMFLSLFNKKK